MIYYLEIKIEALDANEQSIYQIKGELNGNALLEYFNISHTFNVLVNKE